AWTRPGDLLGHVGEHGEHRLGGDGLALPASDAAHLSHATGPLPASADPERQHVGHRRGSGHGDRGHASRERPRRSERRRSPRESLREAEDPEEAQETEAAEEAEEAQEAREAAEGAEEKAEEEEVAGRRVPVGLPSRTRRPAVTGPPPALAWRCR